ncbi:MULTISPECIES: MAP domain-containing protein [Bacillus cereus group]|uniref:MAP domain-containing protein n=3 Tax=Bacillus cereus group TaxID=86661 RepID=A0A0J1HXF4_BACAN|nr:MULTISPECIES: MAP domain-containing protein [Bacillus cereus group]HDR4587774.1 MAP domain-containing protein [Bacillus cytotoxicus]EOQ19711.1 hypothetical protein IKC_04185 [Bacillus cereus VD184]KLV18371.1 hypothetical protein ABW01_13405 [Bacillus anthracis]MBF8118882.1 MAP domain-containing protein [Bacillus cereus]MCC2358439.1 MAP domain-containing protein [Bacillus paranthracis]
MIENYFLHISYLEISEEELWEFRSLEKRLIMVLNNKKEIVEQKISNSQKKVYKRGMKDFDKKVGHLSYEISKQEYDYLVENDKSLFNVQSIYENDRLNNS